MATATMREPTIAQLKAERRMQILSMDLRHRLAANDLAGAAVARERLQGVLGVQPHRQYRRLAEAPSTPVDLRR